MKYRILLSIAMLMMAWCTSRAEDVKYLVINYKSSAEPIIVSLADDPVITFSGNDMIVTENKTGTTYTVAMSDITSAPLSDTPTAIKSVSRQHVSDIVAGHVLLHGLKAGAVATVYSIGGAVVKTSRADSDGNIDMDISTLRSGTYVVKTPVGSLKVRK